MPIKLETPIIRQTLTERQVDFIDIVGEIKINVDKQKATFLYGEFQYIKDIGGNIVLQDGKRAAKRIGTKMVELTPEQYIACFSSTSNKILAKAMEDAMIEIIQQQLESGSEIEYMESEEYIVV